MAMTILNNTAAQMTLGELNKNITQVGKELAKISKGERIFGAAASASEYAITENMRVKIRSLGQDEMNVKSGGDLMRLAEGAVQNQLNIMRTIKERVINAANDSNTDEDRKIIQKEINQFLNEIEDITYETNYNGRILLNGNIVASREILKEWDEFNPVKALRGQKVSWEVLDLPKGEATVVDSSILDIIPNVYDKLDGIDGPFDVFEPFSSITGAADLPVLSLEATNEFKDGVDGKPNYTTIDFSGYNTIEEMDGLNFTAGGKTYILSTNTAARYDNSNGTSKYGVNYSGATTTNSNYVMVDISRLTNRGQVIDALLQKVSSSSSNTNAMAGVPKEGTDDPLKSTNDKLVLKTTYKHSTAEAANKVTATTQTGKASSKKVIYQEAQESKNLYKTKKIIQYKRVSGTGKLPGEYLTGGVVGKVASPQEPDVDPIPAKPPTMTVDISSAANKGITISYPGGTYKLKFLGGKDDKYNSFDLEKVSYNDGKPDQNPVSTTVYTVGINANSTTTIDTKKGTLTLNVSNGKLTLTGPTCNFDPNDENYDPNTAFSVADEIASFTYQYNAFSGTTDPVEEISQVEEFRALKELPITNEEKATDAVPAHATIKLNSSEYGDGNNLADKLIGYEFTYNGNTYKFYDSSSTAPSYNRYYNRVTGGSHNIKGSGIAALGVKWIDISSLRESPSTETLANILQNTLPRGTKVTTVNGEIRLPSNKAGTNGNDDKLTVNEGMEFSHYDVDFTSYFANNPDLKLPDDLYGKGFQVYCASCPKQWFNFNFTGNVIEGQEDMPIIEDAPDIKNIFVDISSVKEPSELVKKIEESANPQLAVSDNGHEHYMFTQALPGSGIIRIYDNRPYNPKDDKQLDEEGRKKLQTMGAKISDGLSDYLKKTYTNIYDDLIETIHHEIALNRKEERLIIHDTTKANRDITLHIPRMTLDQMVGVPEKDFDKELFSVMTKDSRDKMLGTLGAEHYADEKGYLDMAIDYLTNANSTIGSQITRLEQAEKNIVTQNENTTASESVIRDADMAKEMTAFTKNNVIAQAAQSMLAQANQTMGSVLGLLQ